MARLDRSFFNRDTQTVARELLGKVLVRIWRRKIISGRIVEVESYVGEDDLACHAAKGRTPRTDVMYGPAGHAYVYFIYGMHHCLNVVTERRGFPAAVLFRGLEPLEGIDQMRTWRGEVTLRQLANGPGKLTQALHLDRSHNREDFGRSRRLYIVDDGYKVAPDDITAGRRIGVDYAGACAFYPWRYVLGNAAPSATRT